MNTFKSLIEKISLITIKKKFNMSEIEISRIDDNLKCDKFDLALNPFKCLNRNIQHFTYFGNEYDSKYACIKYKYSKSNIWGLNKYNPLLGISISFDDDLKIHRIWLRGKDTINLMTDPGYPEKLPFRLSFGMNRNELRLIMSDPNNSIEKNEDIPNIKNHRTKWDIYYFNEGCIEFGYDYEAERLDQLSITTLPEDLEISKENLRSYQSIQ